MKLSPRSQRGSLITIALREDPLFPLIIGRIFVFVEGKIKSRETTKMFPFSSDKEIDDPPNIKSCFLFSHFFFPPCTVLLRNLTKWMLKPWKKTSDFGVTAFTYMDES